MRELRLNISFCYAIPYEITINLPLNTYTTCSSGLEGMVSTEMPR
jgi:hypothetical protein